MNSAAKESRSDYHLQVELSLDFYEDFKMKTTRDEVTSDWIVGPPAGLSHLF